MILFFSLIFFLDVVSIKIYQALKTVSDHNCPKASESFSQLDRNTVHVFYVLST